MATRQNSVLASKKWTPAKAYKWAEEQAQKAPAHVGYYSPLPEGRENSSFSVRKSWEKINTTFHTSFSPTEKTGTLSRREFFKKLAAFGC